MDGLHATLAALRTETKSEKDHLTVFREFLAQLDELQRHMPVKAARVFMMAGSGSVVGITVVARRGSEKNCVSRTRCGILHAAPQSRDRTEHRRPLRPRLCSAPLREERCVRARISP